jgi:hypothetical protein
MMGVNDSRKVKVWVSHRLGDCLPSLAVKEHVTMAECEHLFCARLIDIVQAHLRQPWVLAGLAPPFKLPGLARIATSLMENQKNPFKGEFAEEEFVTP